MGNHTEYDREGMAVDSLLAACCRSGELDAEATETEAIAFAASAPFLSSKDTAAIGVDVLSSIRLRLQVDSETPEQLEYLDPFAGRTYRSKVGCQPPPPTDLAEGRRRLCLFLGEGL